MKTHDFGVSYHEGIVNAVDSKRHKIRCRIPLLDNLETPWLSYLTSNAGGNKFYSLPDIGELAAILLDSRGEGGCVIGVIYNEDDPTPTSSSDVWKKRFSNGTDISHDRLSGDLTIKTAGKVIVNNSPVVVNSADIIVNDGDVIADGISLKKHLHDGVKRGSDNTNKPS